MHLSQQQDAQHRAEQRQAERTQQQQSAHATRPAAQRLFVFGTHRSFAFTKQDGLVFAEQQWTPRRGFSHSDVRNRVCKASDDDNVYLMDATGQLFVYSISTDRMDKHSSDKCPGASMYSSLVRHNAVLYLLGCDDERRGTGIFSLQLEPAAASTQWQRVCHTNTKHSYTSVGAIGDKIYISDHTSTECCDPAANSCVKRSGTTPFGAGHCVYQEKLYVAGGTLGKPLKLFQCYDPVTDQWTRLADMPAARTGVSLVVYGDRLWAVGGQTKSVAEYDVARNFWREGITQLPEMMDCCGALVL
eukprot:TRINITY_DN3229_c1_g2_i2.p2 TRINITY_DN3229_c1_g2~~TRINITY_DN3229_c1_g2_i2.p2  ORF type:complete len:302 (+),score=68.30 TRINITY_DN3229_c1_g2_i2:35-940(+)